MIRTQMQIDEDVYAALRQVAARQHCSIAACVREAIAEYLCKAEDGTDDLSDIAGKFRPLPPDDVKAHDRYWADAVLSERSEK